MKQLLTIAGSDSSGGAGVQADLKAFSALGAYGMSAICAVTAQNTRGVTACRVLDPGIIRAQIDAVFDDIRVDGVKVGMLGDAASVRAVAAALRGRRPPILVLDPVMVSKSGHRLLEAEAVEALASLLFPLSSLVTPNLPEAEALTGLSIRGPEGMAEAGRRILGLGAGAVLVKGGHLPGEATDVLVDREGVRLFPGERLDPSRSHGTGCSLSSAITALMARGSGLDEAVGAAKDYVARGIAQGLGIGSGCGPIHHFHPFYDAQGRMR